MPRRATTLRLTATPLASLPPSRSCKPLGAIGVSEIFVFAAGAVVAFAVIACLASDFFREELEDQPSNVKSLAGALSFFSVGLALGVAYVVGILLEGLAAWPVNSFLTTIVFIASVGIELAVAHRILGNQK
jgi:hypothetical protein